MDFYHYDAYAQLRSKIVRGFRRDLPDAEQFVQRGLVDPNRFLELVRRMPLPEYARYPNLSRLSVLAAIEEFLSGIQ